MIHDNAHNTERLQAVLIGGDGKVKVVRQTVGKAKIPVLVGRPTPPTHKEKKNENKH